MPRRARLGWRLLAARAKKPSPTTGHDSPATGWRRCGWAARQRLHADWVVHQPRSEWKNRYGVR